MSDAQTILQPDRYYHIYNHAVGKETLFITDQDYVYFLTKLKIYILPVGDLITYCLMPNHFHLIIRTKGEGEIRKHIQSRVSQKQHINGGITKSVDEIPRALSLLFSNFFNTYAKHYNYWNKRTGTLFKRAFRRKEISDMGYLQNLICYIHQNPLKARLADKPDEWKYSSYKSLISERPTILPKHEVIELFGDLSNFIYCHKQQIELEMD